MAAAKRWLQGVLLAAVAAMVVVSVAGLILDWRADQKYREELDLIGRHLREVVSSPSPSQGWLATHEATPARFMSLKVWLASWSIDQSNIDSLSLPGPELSPEPPYFRLPGRPLVDEHGVMHFWLEVDSTHAPLAATFRREGGRVFIQAGPRALTDCLFDPDWDEDGDVDLYDVNAARPSGH